MTRKFFSLTGCFAMLVFATTVQAGGIVWDQGFEVDASGWFDDDDFPGYGDITRVASGTGGITSSEGSFHAIVTDDTILSNATAGPFTRFDGYRNVWQGGFAAEIDVYLDPSWALGEGFDYSVAANGSDGNHQRDFIFHVTKDTSTGMLLVAGSNNTNNVVREDLETLNNYEVTTAGWYTLRHDFYDAGDGSLAVDLSLLDASSSVLFTETRNDLSDVIATEIGGNRYGWFTNVDVTGGINVDAHSLSLVPEPSSVAITGLAGLLGLAGYLRRRWA